MRKHVVVPPRGGGVAVVLAGLLLVTGGGALVAGCAGSRSVAAGRNGSPTTRSASPTPSASLAACLPAHSRTLVVPAGGKAITVALLGSGSTTVVLSNQSDEDLCSWLPFATTLVKAGYRVAVWDYVVDGYYPPQQLTAVVAAVRGTGAPQSAGSAAAGSATGSTGAGSRGAGSTGAGGGGVETAGAGSATAGAGRIVLVGASEGAKTSLIAGAAIRPPVAGVISLSAEAVLRPGMVVATAAAGLRCPVLLVTAAEDPFGATQAAGPILAAIPGREKRLVTVPGSDHGTDLLHGASAATVVPAVIAFLHQVSTG